MSASMKMLSNKLLRQCFKISYTNNCVRGLRRNPSAVYSQDEEGEQLKNRHIRQEPKKNPYSSFELKDPVQKNLDKLASQERKLSLMKHPANLNKIRNQQRNDYSPGLQSHKKVDTKPQTYIKLAGSDKKFG